MVSFQGLRPLKDTATQNKVLEHNLNELITRFPAPEQNRVTLMNYFDLSGC
jgi:hypothetical protein